MSVELPLRVPAFSSLCICIYIHTYIYIYNIYTHTHTHTHTHTPRGASQVVLVVKTLPVYAGDVGDAETQVQSLGWEDPPGEGSGNPLQFSCLENPMDRGAWWATVHGAAKSQTPLSLSIRCDRLGTSSRTTGSYSDFTSNLWRNYHIVFHSS